MITWTDYLRYRAETRGFDLEELEKVLRYSTERYFDTESGRAVVIGRHDQALVMIAYEIGEDEITPVTVHAVSRQQIQLRLRAGRYTNE